MNIRKALAGITAGILASTVMAFNVSAVSTDKINLVYDLKRYEQVTDNATVTITSKYLDSTISTAYTFNSTDTLKFEANQAYLKYMPIVSATIETTGVTNTYERGKTIKNSVTYSKNGTGILVDSNGCLYDGTPVFTDSDKDGYVEFILPITTTGQMNKFNVEPYRLETLGYSSAKDFGFSSVTVSITYEAPAQIVERYADANWSDGAYHIFNIDPYETVYTSISSIEKTLTCGDDAFGVMPSYYGATAITKGLVGDAIYPFKTTLHPQGKENNVISALEARKENGHYYTQPLAVINDAIANGQEVTFTFNTYKGYVATTSSALGRDKIVAGRAYPNKVSAYDWYYGDINTVYNTTSYDYFTYSNIWGYSLFEGALVVNSGITMQLSDVDKFTWDANSISFNWSDITADGNITNAKDFLISMLLYTPVDWYWDSLEVSVGDTEWEDISCGEGLEGEGDEIIEEDEAITELTEPIEEVTEDYPMEIELIVVDENNPTTGNKNVAPIVAMIVASATAAIAVKKFA